MRFAQGHNAVTLVTFETVAPQPRVNYSAPEPLHSHHQCDIGVKNQGNMLNKKCHSNMTNTPKGIGLAQDTFDESIL